MVYGALWSGPYYFVNKSEKAVITFDDAISLHSIFFVGYDKYRAYINNFLMLAHLKTNIGQVLFENLFKMCRKTHSKAKANMWLGPSIRMK